MIRHTIVCCLFYLLSISSAMSQAADSLLEVLHHSKDPCVLLRTTSDLIVLQTSHPAIDSLLQTHEKLRLHCSDKKTTHRFYGNYLARNIGQFSTGLIVSKYDSLTEVMRSDQDTELLLKTIINQTNFLVNHGQRDKARILLESADFSKSLLDSFPKIFAIRSYYQGICAEKKADKLAYYQEAETICLKHQVTFILSNIYNNLNQLFRQINDIKTAKKYLHLGLKWVDPKSSTACTIHHNLGVRYRELGQLDSAKFHIKQSLAICDKNNGRNYSEFSNLAYLEEAFPEAMDYLMRPEVIEFQTRNPTERDNRLGKIGNIEFALNNYAVAEKHFLEAFLLAASNNDPDFDNIAAYYEGYFRSIWMQQNEEKMVDHFEHYKATLDTIIQLNNQNNISQAEVKYQTQKKEKQLLEQQLVIEKNQKKIAEKELQSERQRKWLYLAIFAILSSGILLFFNWKKLLKNKKRAVLSDALLKELQKENQLVLSENKRIQGELTKATSPQEGEVQIAALLKKSIKLFDNRTYCFEDVIYLEKDDDAIHYFTVDEQFHPCTYGSLSKLSETIFNSDLFLRIHRKHLINIYNVVHYNRKTLSVEMANGAILKIAKGRKAQLLKVLDKYHPLLVSLKNKKD